MTQHITRKRWLAGLVALTIGLAAVPASADFTIHNKSSATYQLAYISLYDGDVKGDESISGEGWFSLKPGESKTIRGRFDRTTRFWVVLKNTRTGVMLEGSKMITDPKTKAKIVAAESSCPARPEVFRFHLKNEVVAKKAAQGQFAALGEHVKGLKSYRCLAVRSHLPFVTPEYHGSLSIFSDQNWKISYWRPTQLIK